MFNSQVEALLTVLALSVFADKRVLSTEIAAFIESATEINEKVQSDIPVTEAKLLMWFEMNRIRLGDKVRLGPIGFKHWFDSVMSDLAKFSDRDFLIRGLQRISLSDGELHISEKALCVLVERRLRDKNKVAALLPSC